MAYDKFNILTSSAVPMPIENVDTDQIIPHVFKSHQKERALAIIYFVTGDTMQTIHLKQDFVFEQSHLQW